MGYFNDAEIEAKRDDAARRLEAKAAEEERQEREKQAYRHWVDTKAQAVVSEFLSKRRAISQPKTITVAEWVERGILSKRKVLQEHKEKGFVIGRLRDHSNDYGDYYYPCYVLLSGRFSAPGGYWPIDDFLWQLVHIRYAPRFDEEQATQKLVSYLSDYLVVTDS